MTVALYAITILIGYGMFCFAFGVYLALTKTSMLLTRNDRSRVRLSLTGIIFATLWIIGLCVFVYLGKFLLAILVTALFFAMIHAELLFGRNGSYLDPSMEGTTSELENNDS